MTGAFSHSSALVSFQKSFTFVHWKNLYFNENVHTLTDCAYREQFIGQLQLIMEQM